MLVHGFPSEPGRIRDPKFTTQVINRGIGVSSRQTFTIAYPQPKQNYSDCYICSKKTKKTALTQIFVSLVPLCPVMPSQTVTRQFLALEWEFHIACNNTTQYNTV